MTSYPICMMTYFVNSTNEVTETLQAEETSQFGYEHFLCLLMVSGNKIFGTTCGMQGSFY